MYPRHIGSNFLVYTTAKLESIEQRHLQVTILVAVSRVSSAQRKSQQFRCRPRKMRTAEPSDSVVAHSFSRMWSMDPPTVPVLLANSGSVWRRRGRPWENRLAWGSAYQETRNNNSPTAQRVDPTAGHLQTVKDPLTQTPMLNPNGPRGNYTRIPASLAALTPRHPIFQTCALHTCRPPPISVPQRQCRQLRHRKGRQHDRIPAVCHS